MKVAFVIHQFDPSRGGVERYALLLARGLVQRGVKLTVFTADAPEMEPRAGFQVERVKVPWGPRETRHQRFDEAVRLKIGDPAAWDVIQGFGQTTVHTLYRVGGGTHPAYLSAMSRYWPVWKRAWERFNPKNRIRIETERQIFSQKGLFYIANSERTKREVCEDYGVCPSQILVIHNGVDLEQFHPGLRTSLGRTTRSRWGLGTDDFVLSYVGSGFARKGLRFALEVVARLKEDGVVCPFVVAGRGSTGRYERLAGKLGIADQVRFLGSVDKVEEVYAVSDVFLFPSLYEPFGIAPLEAMACGVPLVITADSGLSEALKHGREGCLLDRPDDVDTAASFVLELAGNPDIRGAFSERARATAERLDIHVNVERVAELYRNLTRKEGLV